MKKCVTGILSAILITGIAATFCQAKTAYVSDMLILTFREGPGTEHQVLQTLKSNTPLTILKEENGFYQVALASGDQGWVDKQYIVFDTPKPLIIEALEREKSDLENRIKTLEEAAAQYRGQLAAQATNARDQSGQLAEQVTGLKTENARLIEALKQSKADFKALKTASRDITGTLEENKRLKAENKVLSQRMDELENDTRRMFKTGMIKWFLSGVGVLLLGWIIGQSVSPKRRRAGSLLD